MMGNAQVHEAVYAWADPRFITIPAPLFRSFLGKAAARARFTTTVASSACTLARRCRRADAYEPAGSAGAVVPALVFPAVDLARAVVGTLVFGTVDF